jgi:hypothetical protein
MGYTYLPDFPQPARARIEATKIQAGSDLEDCKGQLQRASELDVEMRNYILRVFFSFVQEALELGRQGVWTVERIDREVREFLECITLEAQLHKGYDLQGRSIIPLTDHVFGHIRPEVRREFEKSREWRCYQEQLCKVAQVQGSAQSPKPRRAQAPKAVSQPVVEGLPRPTSTQKWEDVQILFLSDDRIQVRIAGQPKTYNYAEFGCMDQRSKLPNKVWTVLRTLALAQGVITDDRRTTFKGWPALEKQIEKLRKLLRDRFNISEDPLPFQRRIGYRLQCRIGRAESFDK